MLCLLPFLLRVVLLLLCFVLSRFVLLACFWFCFGAFIGGLYLVLCVDFVLLSLSSACLRCSCLVFGDSALCCVVLVVRFLLFSVVVFVCCAAVAFCNCLV